MLHMCPTFPLERETERERERERQRERETERERERETERERDRVFYVQYSMHLTKKLQLLYLDKTNLSTVTGYPMPMNPDFPGKSVKAKHHHRSVPVAMETSQSNNAMETSQSNRWR